MVKGHLAIICHMHVLLRGPYLHHGGGRGFIVGKRCRPGELTYIRLCMCMYVCVCVCVCVCVRVCVYK